MASAALGLTTAASWGAGDFCGGLATKRAHVHGVVIGAHASGAVVFLALALASREPVPPFANLAACGAAGLFGALGLLALYRALAMGRMGIAAPVSGVLSAAVPVVAGAVLEGRPGARQVDRLRVGVDGGLARLARRRRGVLRRGSRFAGRRRPRLRALHRHHRPRERRRCVLAAGGGARRVAVRADAGRPAQSSAVAAGTAASRWWCSPACSTARATPSWSSPRRPAGSTSPVSCVHSTRRPR